VTDPNSRIVRDGFTKMPRTAAEFVDYFSKSPIGQLNREDITRYEESHVNIPERAQYYRESVLAEHAKHTRKNSYVLLVVFLYPPITSWILCRPYTISIPMQARAVMKRRAQILIGNKPETVIGLM
jgi:ATP-binding cassette, subfamily G (WHITE), member 2, SNQ2